MKKRTDELSLHSNIAISAVLVLMGALFLLLVVIITLHHDRIEAEQRELDAAAVKMAAKIGKQLAVPVEKIQALAPIARKRDENTRDFDAMAAIVVRSDAIRCVFSAPDGVVRRVYPPKGFRIEVGDDCLAPGGVFPFESIHSGRPVIAGPVPNADGKQILFAFVPVYSDGAPWGIVGAELDFDAVLDGEALEDHRENGFTYRLWPGQNAKDRQAPLWASDGEPAGAAVREKFTGFNLDWSVEAARKYNADDSIRNWLYLAGLILVCVLVAALGYHYRTLRGIKSILESQAMTDNLTGLPNRRSVMTSLNAMIAEAGRTGETFAILYMDLNGFKMVNDMFGHETGDGVLRRTAAILRDNVKDIGHIGRIGGDEFVVLLDRTGEGRKMDRIVEALSDKLRMDVGRPGENAGETLEVTASFGAALYPRNGDDAESLLHAADLEMYQKKKQIKGTTRVGPFKKNFR